MSTNESDSRDLAELGYKQELHRTLGSFSSFAAGFSYISILTGMFQTSYLGFYFAGPQFLWAWPVVLFGQFMVALQFAQLSAHYPLAGSVYQWAKQVSKPAWAWNTGWMYLWAQIVTIPAVALGWQVILPQINTWFQFIKCDVSTAKGSTCTDPNFPGTFDPAFAKNAVILGIAMIVLTTTINMAGVRAMATINNVGVAAELIGATGLIILFAVHFKSGNGHLLSDGTSGDGVMKSVTSALILGAIMPLYVMYGFDSAGSLAEETSDPRKRAPRSVLQALATSGVMGFLLIMSGILATNAPDKSFGAGLTSITTDVLGSTAGKFFLVDVALAIFVCCLAIHAMTVRILFAMARDNSLPAARALASVSGTRRVPVIPAVVSGAIAIVILLVNIGNPSVFTIVISLGIIFMYIAYLGVTLPLLRNRLAGWPKGGDGLFSLGGMGVITNVIAIVWGVLGVIDLEWPRVEYYLSDTYKWGPIEATIGVAVVGLVLWFGMMQAQVGVLDEHRAGTVSRD